MWASEVKVEKYKNVVLLCGGDSAVCLCWILYI